MGLVTAVNMLMRDDLLNILIYVLSPKSLHALRALHQSISQSIVHTSHSCKE